MVGREIWDARCAALLLQANLGQPRIWEDFGGRLRACLWSAVWCCGHTPLAGCVQNLHDVKHN